jgi:mannose/fructose/N-acetylgalactosamine-specific phosphotransferase system component IIC
MFSTGQVVFTVFFILLFTISLVFSYRKDKKLHTKNYKGVKWVGIVFIIFVIFLFAIKYILKN